MSDYPVTEVSLSFAKTKAAVETLLRQEGIRLDPNTDYTCAVYNSQQQIIATGSCYRDTLRCLAVSREHQGEGLMNDVITHLVNVQAERGNYHLFLYTKPSTARFFSDLGFFPVVTDEKHIVFMENRRTGFQDYLSKLKKESPVTDHSAAIVMNANPFTYGHQYLVEQACAAYETVHLFTVSEDISFFPFSVRDRLIKEGTAHLKNVIYHQTGSYMISAASFPSYFQKDDAAVIESHAAVDLSLFVRIAEALNISARFVGEEPTSIVTSLYNQTMRTLLPQNGIQCVIVPRKETDGIVISASSVREALQTDNFDLVERMCPPSTVTYLKSPEALPIIQTIKHAGSVIHY